MSLHISAIITNYNTWPLTYRCIQELENHSNGNLLEILVVDDASEEAIPDSLPDIVRVIQNPQNQGYAASVNIGFSQLRGDIVIVLDSDAYPLMDLTQPLIQAFAANSKLGALGFHLVDKQGQPTGSCSAEPDALGLLLGQRLEALWHSWYQSSKTYLPCLHSCGMAVRRTAFEEVGGFDEEFDFLDADIDFSMQLRASGWSVQVEPSLVGFHEGGGSFQTTSQRVLRYYRNRWRLLAKHGYLRVPLLLKAGLATRHAIEYIILKFVGDHFIPEPTILQDKLYGRQQLLHKVWSGYGNEF